MLDECGRIHEIYILSRKIYLLSNTCERKFRRKSEYLLEFMVGRCRTSRYYGKIRMTINENEMIRPTTTTNHTHTHHRRHF